MKTNLVLLLGLISFTIYSQERFEQVKRLDYFFTYTGAITGYDLQSLGSPQQLWRSPVNPNFLHAVFMKSNQPSGWTDRTVQYLFSNDMGLTWQNAGNIQTGTNARAGYPAVTGLNDGRVVAALHTNDGIAATRTQIYVNSQTPTEWTKYDPGPYPSGELIWPNVIGLGNDTVFFLSSLTDGSASFYNSLEVSSGTFSGWSNPFGGTFGINKFAESENEVLGLTYVGSREDSLTFGNLYYQESYDRGINWSNPFIVYQYNPLDSLGAFRGLDIIFLNDDPYIVFEIVKQDFNTWSYSHSASNKILLWSPALNGGNTVVIADSNNIPYFPNYGSGDMFAPLCRPAIAKCSDEFPLLVVTINGATQYYETENNIPVETFFAGYFMYSTDEGNIWSMPEKFTPYTPLLDWRYISLSPEISYYGGEYTVSMIMQADTNAGSNVNSFPHAESVSAEIVGATVKLGFWSYPGIDIISPAGGETFLVGAHSYISWLSNEINNVKIDYTTDLGNTWLTIISSTPSDGYFQWDIPNTSSADCKVKISNIEDTSYSSQSPLPFTIQGSSAVEDIYGADIPRQFTLYQNFPNPFNPATTIIYGVPEGCDVSLNIYNLLGEKVIELVNGYKDPGNYKINFDFEEYNSGIYFYKIKAGEFVQTKKMILIK